MAILTTTRPLLGDSPSAMLPADRTDEPASGWFVLGTWLILTVVALGFVTVYGNRTPRWEDWFFVPFVTGAQRVDLSWLWESVQGHRVPIPKLVFIACYSLFGFNSKPILYLNVLLFSALSLGLLWAIRKARGRWSYADAFLPIVLLNLGQAEAFSWAQTIRLCLCNMLGDAPAHPDRNASRSVESDEPRAGRRESRPPASDIRRRRSSSPR